VKVPIPPQGPPLTDRNRTVAAIGLPTPVTPLRGDSRRAANGGYADVVAPGEFVKRMGGAAWGERWRACARLPG
jgi:hypothetical protein